MTDDGPTFVTPTVGRVVHYFDREGGKTVGPWAALVTFVHERERDELGEEIGPPVVSLSVFPPAGEMFFAIAPLEGCYDEADVEAHPEWHGGWNWPPRVLSG